VFRMNCQQFTSLIVEAARGRMMDAATRDGAMRHAETCEACAARLAEEQNLTGALRALAAGMKDLRAPARVETNLLAAFRQSHADSQTAGTTAGASPKIIDAPAGLHARDDAPLLRASSRRQTRRNAFVATAIAASLALVTLVTLYKQFTRTATPLPEMTTQVAPQDGKEASPVAPVIATLSSSPASSAAAPTVQAKHERPQPFVVRAASQRTSPKIARTAATPRMIASRQVIDGGRAIFAPGEGESAANHAGGAAKSNDAESVTEFLPLVAGAPAATPLEGGQLVRVRLPRAALASLGLPLNVERDNEPVKADVLIGNDGLARAIRFVR
jgi:hypothetical protein